MVWGDWAARKSGSGTPFCTWVGALGSTADRPFLISFTFLDDDDDDDEDDDELGGAFRFSVVCRWPPPARKRSKTKRELA